MPTTRDAGPIWPRWGRGTRRIPSVRCPSRRPPTGRDLRGPSREPRQPPWPAWPRRTKWRFAPAGAAAKASPAKSSRSIRACPLAPGNVCRSGPADWYPVWPACRARWCRAPPPISIASGSCGRSTARPHPLPRPLIPADRPSSGCPEGRPTANVQRRSVPSRTAAITARCGKSAPSSAARPSTCA